MKQTNFATNSPADLDDESGHGEPPPIKVPN